MRKLVWLPLAFVGGLLVGLFVAPRPPREPLPFSGDLTVCPMSGPNPDGRTYRVFLANVDGRVEEFDRPTNLDPAHTYVISLCGGRVHLSATAP